MEVSGACTNIFIVLKIGQEIKAHIFLMPIPKPVSHNPKPNQILYAFPGIVYSLEEAFR